VQTKWTTEGRCFSTFHKYRRVTKVEDAEAQQRERLPKNAPLLLILQIQFCHFKVTAEFCLRSKHAFLF
jgi:hypothetical protein